LKDAGVILSGFKGSLNGVALVRKSRPKICIKNCGKRESLMRLAAL
jgi:hypothetical protein